MPAPTPARIRELIETWTVKYNPQAWVIEKNAFQLFLTQDEQINSFLASRGVRLISHYTGANKMDLEYGVASLGPLFGQLDQHNKFIKGTNLIEFPRSDNENVKALIEQLVTWSAGTKNKQDGPMALWFVETQIRDYVNTAGRFGQSWVKNPFVTPQDRQKRQVVDLEEFARRSQRLAMGG